MSGSSAFGPAISERLAQAMAAIEAIDPGDGYDPAVPAALIGCGLHLLCLPRDAGGLGGGLVEAVTVLSALGAESGSAALGFAMHTHVVGSLYESAGLAPALRDWLGGLVRDEGALLNSAATEEGSGSPARGGLPATTATNAEGGFRLTGEKTWTTWLPVLRAAQVTATVASGEIGNFVVDLHSAGVERLPGFDALGMRGSASGRLVLDDVFVPADRLIGTRPAGGPDPRGPAPGAWFGMAVAAVYLGIGEGVRRDVVRWAIDRRPGDGSTAVADLPTIAVRLGRIDAALRSARIVVEEVARRWQAAVPADRPALMADIGLAKVRATNAAIQATDEALRIAGGPGFLAGRIERAFRDARAGLINPPLDDIAYQAFARRLVDDARAGSPGQTPR
jgi:alkylation response protein AidB-like acyl-CoA dehydrogenase